VLVALERALQRLPVLALFWDPLSPRANLIVIIDGPITSPRKRMSRRPPHATLVL